MNWEIVALVLVAILIVVLVIFRKNPYVKKYWKYALILLPGVLLIVFRLILIWQESKRTTADANSAKTLNNTINDIKSSIQEANLTSAVEVTIAKTNSADTIKALEDVKKIQDKDERIKKLAEMIG
jgi:glucan phosphoethanolaminetransferase (alkaline phosphatase superfamily)